MKQLNISALALIGSTALLTGCGSYSLGPKPNLPVVEDALPDVSSIVAEQSGNEAALQISKSVGNSAILFAEGLFGSAALTSSPNTVSGADESEFKEQVRSHLADLFLISKSSDFCGRLFNENVYFACKEITSHLKFKITMSGEHEGSVLATFDSQDVIALDFSPSQISAQVNFVALPNLLSTVQSVFNSFNISASLPTLNSASGVGEVSVSRTGSLIQYEVNFPQGADLAGVINSESVHLQLGAESSVSLQYDRDAGLLTANPQLKPSTLTVGANQIQITAPFTGTILLQHDVAEIVLQNFEGAASGFGYSFQVTPVSGVLTFANNQFNFAVQSPLSAVFTDSNGAQNLSANPGQTLKGFPLEVF